MEEKRSRIQGSDEEIIHSVPPKSEVDAALVLYWEQVEHTYHILHEPSFWAEYSLFWQPSQPQQPKSATFAAILVLIVAITKCLSPEQEIVFVGDRSAQRESAAELIDLCDMWLLLHTRKHLTLAFFQLQCLSLLAKRANSIKMKQAWVHSGEVMRLAIATGMHRNPSFKASQKISEFDKEMRRRLWGNIVELEVQSSIDSGLPSSMCGLHCDVQDPSNISDDLLSSTSTSTPSPLPLEKFTRTSYLAWSSQSLQLRVQLMQRLNSPTNSLHYSDVLAYDAQISSLLSSLPNWDQPQAIVPSALLRLQLRQFSLMLHRPYARLAASNASFGYSFTTCVDAANSIASLHDDLRNRGLFFLNHLRADAFRTSMTLAQIIYHVSIAKELSSAPLQTNATDVMANDAPSSDTHDIQKAKEAGEAKALLQIPALPQNDFLMATLCSTSISILENIHSTFEDKTLRLGTAYMEFWLMTAAMGIMPSTSPIVSTVSTSDSTGSLDLIGRGRKAVDRFTSLCFRVLALQKDPGTEFASSLRTTIASASNTPEMQSVATPGGRVTPIMTGSGGHMGQAFMANPEGTSQMLDEAEKGILDNEMDFGMQAMWGDVTQNLPGWDFNEFWMFDSGGSY